MKNSDLQEIVDEIKCPLGAMKISGSEITCHKDVSLYKKVGVVSLGTIKEEISQHCGECKAMLKKMPTKNAKHVALTINEYQEVDCRADSCSVNVVSSCKECPYFAKAEFKKQMDSGKDDDVIKTIPCGFPNLQRESMKVFLPGRGKKKATRAG